LPDEHERVERIPVAGQGSLDESVIGRIPDGGEQHPVEEDLTGLAIQLVLVPRAGRDLDDDRDRVGVGSLAHISVPAVAGHPAPAVAGTPPAVCISTPGESSDGPARYHPRMARPPAGKTAPHASIGVGPALRRAREIEGIALEEAARDTKLSVEQLVGLEDED